MFWTVFQLYFINYILNFHFISLIHSACYIFFLFQRHCICVGHFYIKSLLATHEILSIIPPSYLKCSYILVLLPLLLSSFTFPVLLISQCVWYYFLGGAPPFSLFPSVYLFICSSVARRISGIVHNVMIMFDTHA